MSTDTATADRIIRHAADAGQAHAAALQDSSTGHIADELHYAATMLRAHEAGSEVLADRSIIRLTAYATGLAALLRGRAVDRVHATFDRKREWGTTHRMTTAAGSHVTIFNECDAYGRMSTHIVTGYNRAGLSGYFARNVSARDVCRLVRQAEAAGWTGIATSIEAF